MGNGPFEKMPGTPWFIQPIPLTSGGAGKRAPAPDFAITQKVIIQQKFSANPGVLASGRRPDRPGS